MNTPQPLQLTDRDKGEQCVYCGKDSWTCEHFEPPILDGSESEGRMNNPPAFPRQLPNVKYTPDEAVQILKDYQGMTLRDYFAAAALQAWVHHYGAASEYDEAAYGCFRYADAMLKAREQ